MRKRVQHREPLPQIPISSVLTELGMESVPTGFGWVRCHCFAHEDRTASAAVNHDTNGYICHSCGRKGDSLKLLQTERGLSFREALEVAKGICNISTDKPIRKRRASELLQRGE
jgi:DNA primase